MHGAPLVLEEVARVPAKIELRLNDGRTKNTCRNFAAWMGLTPKGHSTAGKVRLGVITRAGDEMLRSVLESVSLKLNRTGIELTR